jgi:enediyne biosynthesis protein E4
MIKQIKNLLLLCLLSFLLITCKNKSTLFETIPISHTNIEFKNILKERPGLSMLYYLYFYNGGGVSVGDINNDGLPDIYFTANSKGNNKLYLNKGNFVFEDITTKAGVAGSADWCSGVTMADVNSDGFLDIYVSTITNRYGLKGHNELFINKKNGTFTEESEKYGLNTACFTTQTAFFDYDHDGDMDCYILNQSHHPHANIVDTSKRNTYDSLTGDKFFRNDVNTSGRFTDVSKVCGIYQSNLGYGLGIAIGDVNNDGWDDIYVGNDFHENDYYYINQGASLAKQKNAAVTFKEDGANHFKHYSRFSMGNDMADYNNDGQLDLITVDMLPADEKILKTYGSDENLDTYKVKLKFNGYQDQYSKNCLQTNNGDGISFSETSLLSGVAATDWSWCPLFADFDNDGNKDLFISNGIVKRPVDLDYIRFVSDLQVKKGLDQTDKYDDLAIDKMPDGAASPYLFKGDGKTSFKDMSADWGTAAMKGYYTGAAYADLDNDGNVDLVINALNDNAVILQNKTPKKNFVSLTFKDDSVNTFGIGAKAYIFYEGKMQYQQLMLTRGFQSSSETKIHFGLDSINTIDSMLIVWPDEKFQIQKKVSVNKQIVVSKKDAGGIFNYKSFFTPKPQILTDITQSININWKHIENDFLDFNKQYLIPHEQSTRGPKIAVADVNKDGLDDMYLCGATGQAGTLMLQNNNGSFSASSRETFSKDSLCEDVAAIFFDANNDDYPDLYVVSGGNEYLDSNQYLADRFYLNNGKGNFTLSPNALPAMLVNKSCVSTADVDKDGDMDLFVGGLANAKTYGIAQSSYLLLNDGKGNFTKANNTMASLNNIGILTSASFTDLNNDGWEDLVVAGEWMAVKIFINNNGKFKETDIPKSAGLWQTVYSADVNGDGYKDILAGNWGHNNKLYSGKDGLCKLFVKDFDKNGTVEQIMTYSLNGKDYTFLAKDELERSLPVLKKAYVTYSEVAGKDVQFMFYDLFKDYTELKAETLSSSFFLNDGKGNFNRIDLPEELQYAPIFSFASIDSNLFIGAGNIYGVVPYEGRYDALSPTAFSYNSKNRFFNSTFTLPLLDGEVRDIKWLNTGNGKKILALARNNMSLSFFR